MLALLPLLAAVTSCAAETRPLLLASTTSLEDSGLLDDLLPAFARAHPGIRVQLVAVGSGQALTLARRGDADVLLVHSPLEEARFVAEGYAAERHAVMSNAFLLVGSTHDPAGVAGGTDVVTALARIAAAGAPFISRGDGSGTHQRELELWRAAGLSPPSRSDWYLDVGQGMAETLTIANERRAYTLTDEATLRALSDALQLVTHVQDDPRLINPYSVIVVRAADQLEGARRFADWLLTPATQQLIAAFGSARYGGPLFRPALETVARPGAGH